MWILSGFHGSLDFPSAPRTIIMANIRNVLSPAHPAARLQGSKAGRKIRRLTPALALGLFLLPLSLWACAPGTSPAGTPGPTGTLPPPQVTQVPQTPGDPTATPRPTAPASTLDASSDDLAGLELVFWHVWEWESGEALQTLVDEFNITNEYGLRVQTMILDSYSDLNRELEEALAGSERPHLVVGFTNQLNRWAARPEAIVDLQPYLNDAVWGDSPEEQADSSPEIWEQDVVEGVRLGLPAQRTMQVLFYNQTWAEELGFARPPETIEAFTEQACAAAGTYFSDDDQSNDGLGGWVIDTSTTTMLGWIGAFGGQIETPQGYEFAGEEVNAAFGYIKELYDRGCAWLSANRFPNAELATRRALFISSSLSGLPFQQEAFEQAGSDDVWTVLPFPGLDRQPVVPLTGPSFAMIKTSPAEQLGTWVFLKWLLEPERQARWVSASGHLPSRSSARAALEAYETAHPQWGQALDLLPYSLGEPRHASWGTVRWALSDAAAQIYRLGLTLDQLPALQEELDQTAAELHAQAGN